MRKILNIENCLYCEKKLYNDSRGYKICDQQLEHHVFLINTDEKLNQNLVGNFLEIYETVNNKEIFICGFYLNEKNNLWEVLQGSEIIKTLTELNKENVSKIIHKINLLK